MSNLHCIADLCLVPIGTPTPSVSDYVAAVVNLFDKYSKENPEFKYTLHSAGTTLEGSWKDVTEIIGKAHEYVHGMGVLRIQSDIRIGTRTDKSQTSQDKVRVVEEKLKKMAEDN